MSSAVRYAIAFAGAAFLGCGPAVSTPGGTDASTSATGTTTSLTRTSSEPGIPTTSGNRETTSASGVVESSSGDGTGTTSFGTDTSGSGNGFLGPTDARPPDSECDSYLQDCPEGQKCNPWASDGGIAWNALGCFPVAPSPDQPGDPCQVMGSATSGFDTCDLGSLCWDVNSETNAGTCVALCEGSAETPTCADPSSSCTIANSEALNLCLSTCDPLGQDCGDGSTCVPVGDQFACISEPVGGSQPGDPCEFIASCDGEAGCILAEAYGPDCEASACCSSFCDLTAPVCENPNQDCEPWFEDGMAPLGLEHVGVCSTPL